MTSRRTERGKDPFLRTIRFVAGQWRRQWRLALVMAAGLVLIAAAELALPLFAGQMVDALADAARSRDAAVLDAVRRIPFLAREELAFEGEPANDALTCMTIALWFAHHEPLLERGLVSIVNAGGDTDTNAAVAGGLLGARDGARAIPPRWLAQIPGTAELEQLALELAGATAEHPSNRATVQ